VASYYRPNFLVVSYCLFLFPVKAGGRLKYNLTNLGIPKRCPKTFSGIGQWLNAKYKVLNGLLTLGALMLIMTCTEQ